MQEVKLVTVLEYNSDPNNKPFLNRYSEPYKMGYVIVFPDQTTVFVRSNKSVADHALKHAQRDFNDGYRLGEYDAQMNKERNLARFDYTREADRHRAIGYVEGYKDEMAKK